MLRYRLFASALALAMLGALGIAAAQEKKEDEKSGTVVGALTDKGPNWIEVKADGEEKGRKYYTLGRDQAMVKTIEDLKVGSRVRVEWKFQERNRVVKVEVVKLPDQASKEDPEKKSGTVVGTLTAKGDAWIEVQADGEEKARRYVPNWVGGTPQQGGGPDKEMVKTIKDLKTGSRVRVEWKFEERPRVIKVEVLKTNDKGQ
jgi:hypothetical protein